MSSSVSRYETIAQSCVAAHGVMRPSVKELTVGFCAAFRDQISLREARPLFDKLHQLATVSSTFLAMSPAASLYKTQFAKELIKLLQRRPQVSYERGRRSAPMWAADRSGVDTYNMWPVYRVLSDVIKAQRSLFGTKPRVLQTALAS